MRERFTVSLEMALADEFDGYLERKGYGNRSEGVRDLIREGLRNESVDEEADTPCVGVLTYVYAHYERELSKRLTEAHHAHYRLTVTTLHMHVDEHLCVEAVMLRGPASDVSAFATSVIARPGVHHGRLHRIPIA